MLRNVKDLQGYTIQATNGDIGSVRTFYFDDRDWRIRYLVVDTGNWLPGKRVLLSPESLHSPLLDTEYLPVNLTRDQVRDSPDIDTDRPVSRQQEVALHNHYNWPAYWTMYDPFVAQDLVARPGGPPVPPPGMSAATPDLIDAQHHDVHLHSMREVIGYYIQASDGQIGHVEDFIIETDTWAVRYCVIDTRNWLPGKKVLVAPDWIREVNWTDSQVHIELSRDQIKDSPEFDASTPVNRDYELKLYDYYGRPTYWS